MTRTLLMALGLWVVAAPAVHAAPRQLTVLYSADERGEIEPCG